MISQTGFRESRKVACLCMRPSEFGWQCGWTPLLSSAGFFSTESEPGARAQQAGGCEAVPK